MACSITAVSLRLNYGLPQGKSCCSSKRLKRICRLKHLKEEPVGILKISRHNPKRSAR